MKHFQTRQFSVAWEKYCKTLNNANSYWTDWISPNNITCDHILFAILNWSISSRNYSTTWVWHHAGLVYQQQMRPCYHNFGKQWLVSCIVTRGVNQRDLSSYGQRSPGPISLCIAGVSRWLPNVQTLPRKLEPTAISTPPDEIAREKIIQGIILYAAQLCGLTLGINSDRNHAKAAHIWTTWTNASS